MESFLKSLPRSQNQIPAEENVELEDLLLESSQVEHWIWARTTYTLWQVPQNALEGVDEVDAAEEVDEEEVGEVEGDVVKDGIRQMTAYLIYMTQVYTHYLQYLRIDTQIVSFKDHEPQLQFPPACRLRRVLVLQHKSISARDWASSAESCAP